MKKSVVKKVGRPADEHTEEIKRYVGSLSEDFQHKVSVIGEQFDGLNKKIDQINGTLDEHTVRFEKIDRKLDSHAQMIARVMEDVEEIKSGMREKVDRSEFAKLEKRLVVLEATVYGGKKK